MWCSITRAIITPRCRSISARRITTNGPRRAATRRASSRRRALEKSRYLAAIFAILEGENLVRLQGEEKKGREGWLSASRKTPSRAKLDKQGSMYAQADAFRIYQFRPGKWAGLLIETVGSVAARRDAEQRWHQGSGAVFAGG